MPSESHGDERTVEVVAHEMLHFEQFRRDPAQANADWLRGFKSRKPDEEREADEFGKTVAKRLDGFAGSSARWARVREAERIQREREQRMAAGARRSYEFWRDRRLAR